MLRLLRISGGTVVALGFIFLFSALGARLPDQPICLTITVGRDTYLLDVYRGLLEHDSRYSTPLIMPYLDLDYTLSAYPDQENSRRVRLMLENREEGETILLEETAYSPESGWWGNRTAWSHDHLQFAYLWQNAERQEHLTVFNLADRSKQTAALPQFDPLDDDVLLVGWSADGNFLTLYERDMRSGAALHLWSVEMMQPVVLDPDLPKLLDGAWSPQGDIYAAITQQENGERFLLIIPPENVENTVRVSIPADIARNIIWSPSGDQLVLARQRLLTQNNVWLHQWFFELFNRDGTPIRQDIVGKSIPQPAPGEPPNAVMNFIPGFWSLDGRHWIFLQDHANDNFSELVSLDTLSGSMETIETNLVSDLVLEMFFPAPSYFSSFQQEGVPPDNRQLMLPLWRDEAVTLEYVNFERDLRFTLVEGAREILDSAFVNYFPALIQTDDKHFVVAWSDFSGEAHLRVVSSTDGELVVDIGDMASISHIQWLGEYWRGFYSRQAGESSLELVNTQTREHWQVLNGLITDNPWLGILSPDQRQIAVFLSDSQQLYANAGGRLYMVSLENGNSHLVADDALAYPRWSPDGSMLAYPYKAERSQQGIQVVNAEGETIQRTLLPRQLTNQYLTNQWSRCEADPPVDF